MAKKGDLKVWWIPQIPMKSFDVLVKNVDEAILLLTTLAEYDKFQYDWNVKPDYSNAGGLIEFDGVEWLDYYDEEGRDIDEIMIERGESSRFP